MYKLVLIRHGESTWNKENRFTGWHDVELSDKGRSEAKAAGELLKKEGFSFDIAYVSVLKRALNTLWGVLTELDQLWIPMEKTGALTSVIMELSKVSINLKQRRSLATNRSSSGAAVTTFPHPHLRNPTSAGPDTIPATPAFPSPNFPSPSASRILSIAFFRFGTKNRTHCEVRQTRHHRRSRE